jgi:hypothetical protein
MELGIVVLGTQTKETTMTISRLLSMLSLAVTLAATSALNRTESRVPPETESGFIMRDGVICPPPWCAALPQGGASER